MNKKLENTEEKILQAAKQVFMKKGRAGARMQEIADEAGINKSLLHYYFRSKDKLFEAVFYEALNKSLPKIGNVLNADKSFFDKIRSFTYHYIDFFIDNPYLPIFILNEISSNPEIIIKLADQIGAKSNLFLNEITTAVDKSIIKPIDPRQLIINLISLCVFPFIAKPLAQALIFNNEEKEFLNFIEKRKIEVAEFIINSIRK
ncbi:MAG: TetR/AcrR family transcriptional regulator [Bacteroidales bacterium]|nr:TetR/AcrR family transcriptional regulator [Bacteroidales bacterium]